MVESNKTRSFEKFFKKKKVYFFIGKPFKKEFFPYIREFFFQKHLFFIKNDKKYHFNVEKSDNFCHVYRGPIHFEIEFQENGEENLFFLIELKKFIIEKKILNKKKKFLVIFKNLDKLLLLEQQKLFSLIKNSKKNFKFICFSQNLKNVIRKFRIFMIFTFSDEFKQEFLVKKSPKKTFFLRNLEKIRKNCCLKKKKFSLNFSLIFFHPKLEKTKFSQGNINFFSLSQTLFDFFLKILKPKLFFLTFFSQINYITQDYLIKELFLAKKIYFIAGKI